MKKSHPQRIATFYTGLTAVTAFVTQPVPALDELIVVPLHYSLCRKIARARGVKSRDLPWRQLRKIIWYGAGARLVANFSLGLVPMVGMFSNAITAAVLTRFLAQYLDHALDSGRTAPPEVTMESLRAMFDAAIRRTPAPSPTSTTTTTEAT